jgi:hypothetical protein
MNEKSEIQKEQRAIQVAANFQEASDVPVLPKKVHSQASFIDRRWKTIYRSVAKHSKWITKNKTCALLISIESFSKMLFKAVGGAKWK